MIWIHLPLAVESGLDLLLVLDPILSARTVVTCRQVLLPDAARRVDDPVRGDFLLSVVGVVFDQSFGRCSPGRVFEND